MSDLLDLPGWKMTDRDDITEENGGDPKLVLLITAKYILPPKACPGCGVLGPKLHEFGTRKKIFKDLPIRDAWVRIITDHQRYKCLECGRTFYPKLGEIDEDHRATVRLVKFVKKTSLSRTFASVGREVDMDEKTVRLLFQEHVEELEKNYHPETPEWLGIDEIHLLDKPRCVLGNVKERTVFDILKNRNQKTVGRYLSNMKNKERIELVAMDMWRPYKDSVKAVLPHAQIVVDKFHIVRMANQSLDAVRKNIREGLTASQRKQLMHDRFILLRRNSDLDESDKMVLDLWTSNFPLLGDAYRLKEDFFNIWNANSRGLAVKWYASWKESIPEKLQPFFKDLTTAMENWEDEIFAYFDYPITNAYTESLNGIIKLTQRVGRGYSFDAIRAKVLFSEGLHKRILINPRVSKDISTYIVDHAPVQFSPSEIILDYGIDLSTLDRFKVQEDEDGFSIIYSG